MEHNKSKRRRQRKIMLRILRNPQERERLVQDLLRSPMRKLPEQKAEVK